MDAEFLVKLLMLTTSDADPEALSAIRKANQYLQSFNKSWADIVVPPQTQNEWPPRYQSNRGQDPFQNYQQHEPGGNGTICTGTSTCNCFRCEIVRQAKGWAEKKKSKDYEKEFREMKKRAEK